MNEVKYLDSTTDENMQAIRDYIKEGYLTWVMLEADPDSRLEAINEVFGNVIANNPMKIFSDYENSYLAALRAMGDKTKKLLEQIGEIRSGIVWKKL